MNNFISELLFAVFALVLVSLFAWLVLKAVKSMHPNKLKTGKIEVLASIPVGARERILVIQHHEKEYMLGVSAGGITVLDKFPVHDQEETEVSGPS